MFSVSKKQKARTARRIRVRHKIHGTAKRPRLAVFKSAYHVYAQIVDDDKGNTLVAASSLADKAAGKGKARAAAVGKLVAERALEKGIKSIVFDRSSYQYHGQIKELADAARTAGLQF